MNAKPIGYWITLVLFCIAMGAGAFADLTQNPTIVASMKKLGYPDYVATLLGFWKIAGVITILIPGFGLVKEWAYAGFVFDLTGASVSHFAIQDPMPEPLVPLLVLAIGMASWYLRPASRRVGVAVVEPKS